MTLAQMVNFNKAIQAFIREAVQVIEYGEALDVEALSRIEESELSKLLDGARLLIDGDEHAPGVYAVILGLCDELYQGEL